MIDRPEALLFVSLTDRVITSEKMLPEVESRKNTFSFSIVITEY